MNSTIATPVSATRPALTRLIARLASRPLLWSSALAISLGLAHAQSTSWTPAGTGAFSTPANWSTGLPTSIKDTFITNGTVGTPTIVNLTTTGNVANLTIGANNTLNVTPAGGLTIYGTSFANTGALNVNGGAGFNSFFYLANAVTFSGSGVTTLTASPGGGDLFFRNGGGGSLINQSTIRGGANFDSGMAINNQGTFDANTTGQALRFSSGPITNTGTMRATGGGVLSISGITVTNGGGTLASAASSNVSLSGGVRVVGGTLNSNGGTLGTAAGSTATVDGGTAAGAVTLQGTYTGAAGSVTYLDGTITNQGDLVVKGGAGANTYLYVGSGGTAGATINGGTVTMETLAGGGVSFLRTGGGTGPLTLSSTATLRGAGLIDGSLAIVNQGTINANVSGGTLAITGGSVTTNTGTMQATGGGKLQLANGSTILNQFGTISSSAGSTVDLTSGIKIQGGTLNSNGGTLGSTGTVYLNGSTLGAMTLQGTYTGAGSSSTYFDGNFTNQGNVLVKGGAGSNTFLYVGNASGLPTAATFNGGTVTLESLPGGGNAFVRGAVAGSTLTNSSTSTIQGAGAIDFGLTLVNQGTVNANVSGGTLGITSIPVTNTGTMQATGGGVLSLSGNTTNNQGGTISSSVGSTVSLTGSATVQGGTLNSNGGTLGSAAGNIVFLNGSTFGAMTLQGTYTGAGDSSTYFDGNFTNQGNVLLKGGAGSNTFLYVGGTGSSATLNGGTVTLESAAGGGSSFIRQAAAGKTLTNSSTSTIQGTGIIDSGLTLVNQGTVNANTSGQTLALNNSPVTNTGTLQATGGGVLSMSGGTTNNQGGTISSSAGSTVSLNAGAVIQGGTLNSNGGTLGTGGGNIAYLNGTTFGPITLQGTYTAAAGSNTILDGTINNQGSILVNGGAGANAFLYIGNAGAGANLTGGGTVTLETAAGGGASFIRAAGAGQTLTNTDNTIRGAGFIDQALTIVNGAAGTFLANAPGQSLVLNNTGTTTNNGTFKANAGSTLQVDSTLTNYSAGTLTGGTYLVTGAAGQTGKIQLSSLGNSAAGQIVNNAATIVLNGPTANTLLTDAGGNNALKPLANNSGSFTVNGGYGFTAAGNLTNSGTVNVGGSGSSLTVGPANTYTQTAGLTTVASGGTLTTGNAQISGGTVQLAGGTFNATTSLTNNSGATITGNGTLNARPANSGTIVANGGTLTVSTGISGPTGTVQVNSGATLSLAGGGVASTAGTLAQNGTLALGTNNVTVSNAYTNANFGTGNSFNGRANVSGTGQILAAGDVNQTITGASVTGGTTATPTLAGFGNIRTGQTATVTYNVANSGTTGPSIVGALQTNVNGGNITDARLSGTGVTAGNYGPLAAGQAQAYSVTFNGTTAGALAAGQKINVTNNFDNVRDQLITLGSGAVYQAAVANTLPTTVNVGNFRVGGTASTALNISNVAPATGGFTETLGATVTGTSGSATTGGSISGLTVGASSNAITVGLNTSAAGVRSGTATVGFTSTEINGSGLGTIGVGSQTVNVTGTGYRLAEANLGSLAFGNVLIGSTQTRNLTVTNGAISDGFSEGLNASFGSASGASAGLLSLSGTINNLAAGLSNGSQLQVTLNTSATGVVTASVQVLLTSNGSGTSGLGLTALPTQSVAVSGDITGVVGTLASAAAITPNPVNLGNYRVGAVAPTQALTVTNSASGPAEGLNAAFTGATGGVTTTGSASAIAPGGTNNTALRVGLNTATAGLKNGIATVGLTSDGTFNGGVTTALASQGIAVTGAVYQAAAANTLPTTVTGLNARIGGSASTTLNVTNAAANTGGYTETLGASVTGTSGSASSSGSISGLTQGSSSGAIALGLNTATAGAKSGSATVGFTSAEINGSGLGTIGAGSQTVNLTGSVYQVAAASTLPTTVNLGTVRTGTVVNTTLGVSNVAPATGGFTETLGGSFGTVGSGLTGTGSFTGLGIGAGASNALSVGFTAGAAGAFNRSATVNFNTEAIGGSGLGNLAIGSQTVNFSAQVNAIAQLQVLLTSGFNFTLTGANSGLLDFGSLTTGSGSLLASLDLLNSALGQADSLKGSFNAAGLAGGPFAVVGGSPYDLLSGARQGFQIAFNTNVSSGFYTATLLFTSASHNSSQSDLALDTFSLSLRGQLNGPGGGLTPVPEPSTYALFGCLTLLGVVALRRRAARRN